MSRFNRTKMWRFAKPWLPAVGMLVLAALLGLGFVMLVSLDPTSMLPGLPVLACIGSVGGAVFFSVNAIKETVVARMFYPSVRAGYKQQLKALRKERAKYIGYAFNDRGDRPNSYLRSVRKLDIQIGELTGKGYDEPDYDPTGKG